MFIHQKTGRPAWLQSQDEAGVVYSDGDRRHSLPSQEFFSAWREATAAELKEHAPARPAAAAKPAAPKRPRKEKAPKADKAPKAAAPPAAASEPPKPHVTVQPLP